MRKQEWELEQINNSTLSEKEKQAVKKFLSAIYSQGLEASEAVNVVTAVKSLVEGSAIAKPVESEEFLWVDARPGALTVRDRVRVKADAYKSDAGLIHNGREGVIVAIRYGDIHVRYEDSRGTSEHPVKHSPFALEKRMARRIR